MAHRRSLTPASPLKSYVGRVAISKNRLKQTGEFSTRHSPPLNLSRYFLLVEIITHSDRAEDVQRFPLYLVIRLEARLQPNIGFTLRSVSAVLTRSAVTSPKVNRSG